MSPRPDHLELAERLIDLHRHAMDLIGDILRRSTSTDAPSPILAIPRAQDKDGSDSAGAVGARERGILRTGSEQTPTAEAQGRNEPASVEAVAGAKAGEVGIASSPVTRDLKRDKILDLWATGMSKEAIAEATGSTPISVNTTVVIARRCNDPRAVRRSETFEDRREKILDLYAKGNLPAAIAREMGTPLKGIETVLYRARKAGEPRAAKHKPTKAKITEFAGKGRGGDGDAGRAASNACGNASMPSPAKPTHDAANEKQREIARDFLAKRDAPLPPRMPSRPIMPAKPIPAPYSTPMEPTEAKPIPKAELPAPVPMLKVSDDTVMIVADGVVHGPDGIEERLMTPQLMILTRMADGGMYPDKVLSEISGATNGTLTYLMNGMRGKLDGIGVELFVPMTGFWRARRAS